MGLGLIWKSSGIGSQDALGQFGRQTLGKMGRRDLGHSGTLDPFAEGLLLVAWDEGTKLLAPLIGLPKTYEATIVLGATSETLDTEAPWIFPSSLDIGSRLDDTNQTHLEHFLASKVGVSQQIPPQYSAIKVGGKRSYDLARSGTEVQLKPRSFEIVSAEHLGLEALNLDARPVRQWRVRLTVTSGTYIRAIARDFGQELLGFPGALRTLVRTSIGPFCSISPFQGVKPLGVEDLIPLFGIIPIGNADAIALRSYGRWTLPGQLPASIHGKWLVQGPGSDLFGWVGGDPPKLQRVFTKCPIQA